MLACVAIVASSLFARRGYNPHLFSVVALFAPLVPFCAAFMFSAYCFMSFCFRLVCGFLCHCKRLLSFGVCLYAYCAFVASGGAVGLVVVLFFVYVYVSVVVSVCVYVSVYVYSFCIIWKLIVDD